MLVVDSNGPVIQNLILLLEKKKKKTCYWPKAAQVTLSGNLSILYI